MATNFWGFDGTDSLADSGGQSATVKPIQLPDLVVDDLMIMFVSLSPPTDGGVVPTVTSTPSGWTEWNTNLNGELRTYIYYRRALTVDDVWPDMALSATVNWCVCQARIRDADWVSGPFGNSNSTSATNSNTTAAPAATTAANNSAILLYAAVEYRTISSLATTAPRHNRRQRVSRSSGSAEGIHNSAMLYSDYIFASGTAAGGQSWGFSGTSNDQRLWTIEIRTNGNVVPPWISDVPITTITTTDYDQGGTDAWRDAFMASGKLLDADTIATYSFDASTVTTGTSHNITITAHGITSSRVVQADANGNTLPTGLTSGAYYWVRVIDADTVRLLPCDAIMSGSATYFKISTNPGAFLTAVNITAAGTGTCLLKDAGMVWSMNNDALRQCSTGNVADVLGNYKGDAGFHQNWVGYSRTWTSVLNLTGYKPFLVTTTVNATNGIRYGVVVFIDSSNNWAAYKVYDRKYSTNTSAEIKVFNLDDPDVVLLAWRSSGTLDLANIKHIVWACKGDNGGISAFGSSVSMSDPQYINTLSVVGGTATAPLTYAELADYIRLFSANTINVSSEFQFVSRQPLIFGNGTNKVYWIDEIQSIGHFALSNGVNSYNRYIDITKYSYNLPTPGSLVSILTSQIGGGKTEWNLTTTTPAGAIKFDNTTFSQAVIMCDNNVPLIGCIFDACTITQNGTAVTGCVFQDSIITSDNPESISGGAFTSGGTGHGIVITTPGTYDFIGNTFTGYGADGSTDAAIYNNSGGLVTLDLGQGDVAPTVRNGAGASTTINAIQNGLNLSGLVSGSQVYVFTTATQSVLDSTESSGTTYTYVSSDTVDVTIYKSGYLPIRLTGINLGAGSYVATIDQIADPNYNAGHGLTYTTDASFDPGTNLLTVPSWAATRTVRNVYSLLIDSYIDQATLKNKAFPFQMNGGTSLFLLDDCECTSDAQARNMVGGGIRYVSSAGATTAEFVGCVSLGVTAGLQPEYEQVDGGTVTDARATGNVNEIIKVYGDASHGNFDDRDSLEFKVQANGYRQAEADLLALAGVAALEPILYSIPLPTIEIVGLVIGDPAPTGLSITDDSASPVSWDAGDGAKDYSITITDAGTNSGETILRWLNYNLSLDATFQGKNPFYWPELVIQVGANYETLRGILHSAGGDVVVGVRVIRTGGTPHPDFSRFQSDDGTYGTPPSLADLSVDNIVAGSRLQVYNVTTDTEMVNEVVAGTSYTDTYTEGTGYTSGDQVRIRLTYQNGTTAKCGWTTTVVASANGWAVSADQQDCPVYNDLAIDGSTITDFAADYVDNEVDVIVGANFYISDWWAWWVYNQTTEDGIRNFFGGATAEDVGNFMINVGTVDIVFDNITATEVWALDNRRVRRSDGTRPIKNPTSGGGGIDMEWREKVLLAETGVSGLTTEEATTLAKLDAVAVKADEIHRIHGLKSGEPMTVTPTSRAAGSITQAISGDGTTTSTVTRV